MGAKSVASVISSSPFVSNVNWEYDSKLQFDYETKLDFAARTFKVYMPSRDDYEISIEVVERAIEFGAKLIVYDNWIRPTISGKSHAQKNGITVYSYGFFLNKIKKGEAL